MRADFNISKEVWDSMVICLTIVLVHQDLFPSAAEGRELMLRGIIQDHYLDKVADEHDKIYRVVCSSHCLVYYYQLLV